MWYATAQPRSCGWLVDERIQGLGLCGEDETDSSSTYGMRPMQLAKLANITRPSSRITRLSDQIRQQDSEFCLRQHSRVAVCSTIAARVTAHPSRLRTISDGAFFAGSPAKRHTGSGTEEGRGCSCEIVSGHHEPRGSRRARHPRRRRPTALRRCFHPNWAAARQRSGRIEGRVGLFLCARDLPARPYGVHVIPPAARPYPLFAPARPPIEIRPTSPSLFKPPVA